MIQTLLNSLINIWCNGVKKLKCSSAILNLKIFVYHFKLRILENAFLVHTYMVVRRYNKNFQIRTRLIILYYSHPTRRCPGD